MFYLRLERVELAQNKREDRLLVYSIVSAIGHWGGGGGGSNFCS